MLADTQGVWGIKLLPTEAGISSSVCAYRVLVIPKERDTQVRENSLKCTYDTEHRLDFLLADFSFSAL